MCRIFVIKKDLLFTNEDFFKSWNLLFDYIESSALSKNAEVSLSALKCFQDLFCSSRMSIFENTNTNIENLWDIAWKVW